MWKDGVRQGAATQPINQWGVHCTAITDLGEKKRKRCDYLTNGIVVLNDE